MTLNIILLTKNWISDGRLSVTDGFDIIELTNRNESYCLQKQLWTLYK